MIELLCQALGALPVDCLSHKFMQQALLGLLLLAPMTAVLGVEVIHFRMSFFSDAIGHSAFAGVALGLLLSLEPKLTMLAFGVLVGLGIVALQRRSNISSDLAIGVVFSAVVAFGLAVVSRTPGTARSMQQFLFGDILTIGPDELRFLLLLLPVVALVQILGFNSLLCVALNPVMARAHGVHVAFWQYLFAALLAVVVIFSVWAVGVLLVTALLIVPAACARNISRSLRGMFWWAIVISVVSAFTGLVLSAQPWLSTATGATIIVVSCLFFALSTLSRRCLQGRRA
ncbi:MAG: metal ABC transporter permease [Desulfovibrionaceae bacterium]|nr:metal ABC transporter permease [Desulfovibrionaceae bacterium]